MVSIESRLRRLEAFGGCPRCEEAHGAVLRSLCGSAEDEDAPLSCPSCGADARPTIAEIDELLAQEDQEGEGVRS